MRFSLIEDKFSINYDDRCPICGNNSLFCNCSDVYGAEDDD
ncbi:MULTISPECIES: hypothetical protein [unclassified Campylobacter]